MSSGMFEMSIGNSLEELARLNEGVHGFLEGLELPMMAAYAVDLTLEEVITNIIKYGYDDTEAHLIDVALRSEKDHIVIQIEDDGHTFDPLKAPPPVTHRSLEDSKIGGLGLHLVRNLAAEMRYTRIENKNRLETWISRHDDEPDG